MLIYKINLSGINVELCGREIRMSQASALNQILGKACGFLALLQFLEELCKPVAVALSLASF